MGPERFCVDSYFLSLRVTQKARISLSFLCFFLPSAGRTGKSYLYVFATLGVCDQDRTYQYSMSCTFKPCHLEISSNGGF